MRTFLKQLEAEGSIVRVSREVSPHLEAARLIKNAEPRPILFENINGWKVVANLFATREAIAKYFSLKSTSDIVPYILNAIDHPTKPERVERAPCQEKELKSTDELPILFHAPKDGGPYISSGVLMSQDKDYGRNLSFHRMMLFDKNKFAIRLVPRHTYEFLKRAGGELDASVVIGNGLNILIAGATSVEIGFDELTIANTLKPLKVVKCKTNEIEVPAESEIVIEGRIISETHSEGPFVDLTETYDIVREQPVFEVKKITCRKDAIYHALLPGGFEHKMLMGLPREPTIFREVNKSVKCLDVYLTPGGCSWLHGVVKIKKEHEDDGKKAIEAAFKGHQSMKHVVVVDEDIDIANPHEVEWAIATRFQAKDRMVLREETGSSLDPSADPQTRMTSKVGIDATKPLVIKGKNFNKVKFGD